MVRAGADFSGMRKEMQRANKNLTDFKSGLSKTMKGITATLGTLAIGSGIKSATKDAMTFEASMQQVERTLGSSASTFKMWAKENATAFGMSKLEAAKYGAVYSNLISTFSQSTSEATQRTTDLLKASAVVASSTGRTMEDTMERIRSGLLGNTEAIEDLGINVNVAMIESTNAFKQFANGKSWQQLNFQTQQQIRLMAILEQATTKYGNEIANNTISRQQQLVAQLNNTKLALGQAFLPIYNSVLPALIRMATAMANAMTFVAQFSRALFGGSTKQQTKQTTAQAGAVSGLGDAYKKAGKKAKGAVASFDELNLIGDKPDAGAADDAGAGAGGGLIDDGALGGMGGGMEEVSAKAQAMAAKVKEAFATLSRFITDHKDIIIAALAGLATAFAGFWIATKWASIVTAIQRAGTIIMGVLTAVSIPVALVIAAVAGLVAAFVYFYRTNEGFRNTVNTILQKIGEIATWLWQNVLVPFGEWLGTVMVEAWKAIGVAAEWLWDNVLKPFGAWLADVLPKAWDAVAAACKWLWDNVLKPFGAWLMDAMPKAWDAVKVAAEWLWKNVLVPFGEFLKWLWDNVLVPIGKVLIDILGVAFKKVADVAKSFWENVLVPLGKALKEMFGPAVEAVIAVLTFLWKNVFKPLSDFVITVVKGAFENLVTVITFLWKNVLKPLTEYVGGIFKSVFDNVFRSIGQIIEGAKDIFVGLMKFITGVFTGDWAKAWEGVKQIFKGVFESLWGIVKYPLNMIIDGINALIGGLNKLNIDVPSWVGKIPGIPNDISSFGFNIPKIPKLAKGGLAFGPTLAMVGDNRGAAANPEVIAPLSELEGMMQGGDNAESNRLLGLILQAVKSSSKGDVVISRSAIGQAAIAEIKDITRRTGQVPFPV